MNIYLSHSSHYDYKKKLYQPLEESGLLQEFDFILPHKNSDEPFDVKGALERGEIDFVIAEISYPSAGQGIELAWANALGIPIECIYMEDSFISPSLRILTDKFFDYETDEEMIEAMKIVLIGHA